jgi:hypothetical protein
MFEAHMMRSRHCEHLQHMNFSLGTKNYKMKTKGWLHQISTAHAQNIVTTGENGNTGKTLAAQPLMTSRYASARSNASPPLKTRARPFNTQ